VAGFGWVPLRELRGYSWRKDQEGIEEEEEEEVVVMVVVVVEEEEEEEQSR